MWQRASQTCPPIHLQAMAAARAARPLPLVLLLPPLSPLPLLQLQSPAAQPLTATRSKPMMLPGTIQGMLCEMSHPPW
jgi:hypothetical protein